ncbi:class I SAM-dependent DNA methyltransferase [Nitrososphaera viennensis]|uniref:Class I SAM-dependent methyltransferase n=2 Tax=Nitrososphaera viennensis TaxID=1034015 RepID=A0A977NN39_9ARCH|nr:class I SAM-dependent methyltransferase [Nitrososphaera viennensis]AIC15113.1 putative methyltransferase [Nitrososphaera viennensis EN76]UVS70037.1 class I SAM-dependent methyltransferase [Nitrososphaera viennensis]
MKNSETRGYWEERLAKNFDLSGVGFSTLGKKYNEWMYRIRRHVLLKTLGKLDYHHFGDNNTTKILDIGVGTGFYIDFWKKWCQGKAAVAAVDGVDITNVAVERMKKKYHDSQFYVADIGENNVLEMFGKKRYDVISAFDVLFHITNDEKYRRAIQNIYALLEPAGIFVLSENFVHSNLRANFQVNRSKGHIERLLSDTGFQIIERTPMFVLMNAPVNSDSRVRKYCWRSLTRLVSRGESAGFVMGAAVYPVERLLLSVTDKGPSTELIICKKA